MTSNPDDNRGDDYPDDGLAGALAAALNQPTDPLVPRPALTADALRLLDSWRGQAMTITFEGHAIEGLDGDLIGMTEASTSATIMPPVDVAPEVRARLGEPDPRDTP